MNALDSIDHIALSVANIEASIKWYQTSFKCTVLYQNKQEAMLQFANVKLALILPSQEPAHIAFDKDDAGTYGELHLQTDGSKSTIVGDPTGNIVELIAPKDQAR